MKRLQLFLLAVLVTLGLNACEKKETSPVMEVTDPTMSASFELDGRALLLPEGKDGYMSTAVAERSVTATGCLEKQGMQLAVGQSTIKSLRVTLQKQLSACATSCTELESLFALGTYAYAGNDPTSTANGVVVSYRDVDGTLWSTDLGTADQTGSSFEIVGHEDHLHDVSKKKTQALFNCKLYNANGQVQTLTNGLITSRSVNCSNLK